MNELQHVEQASKNDAALAAIGVKLEYMEKELLQGQKQHGRDLAEMKDTFREMRETFRREITEIKETLKSMDSRFVTREEYIQHIRQAEHFISLEQFKPVQLLTYGIASAIGITVITYILKAFISR